MSTSGEEGISSEVFQQLVERSGLGLSQKEIEELKPLYDLYLQNINQVHSIDFQAEEIAMTFHPDWAT
jgi:hypothetical protein